MSVVDAQSRIEVQHDGNESMFRAAATLSAIAAASLVVTGCGSSSSEGGTKSKSKTANVVVLKNSQLQDAVIDPVDHASYTENAVAQCLNPSTYKDLKVPKGTDCSDPATLAKYQPAQKAALELGNKPGGVIASGTDPMHLSVTAFSKDIPGAGVIEWTYSINSKTSSDIKRSCKPEVKGWCEKGTFDQYVSVDAQRKISG